MPTGVQSLPEVGILSVKVFLEGESTPRYTDNAIAFDQEEIALEFDAPVGQHIFIVIFDYLDPEFLRENGEPWELARWSSELVTVIEGEELALDVAVDGYRYEDFDGDGISNKDELIARSDPGDASDVPDYAVTATVSEGGSIDPPSQRVNHGSTVTFSLTPETGYSISTVTGCNGTLTGNIYTTDAITADCAVNASFVLNRYTVDTIAGSGGTISPASRSVAHGETATFRLFLAPGFDFSEVAVSGCNGTLTLEGIDLVYTTGAITSPCTVSATFSLNEYAVTAGVTGEGGTITPTSRIVIHGSTTTFTVTPAAGYTTASVTGCNGTLNGNIYTTGEVTAACSVTAVFSLNAYLVTATAGANGNISPASRIINHGSTGSFTVTPNTGYRVASVTGCGGTLDGNSYTTGAITGACTVTATFSLNTYEVTATAGANGNISPASRIINHGSTGSFTVTPNTGYRVASVTGCGGTLDGNSYTTGAITAACTVNATFGLNDYLVTATAGPNGNISPASLTVNHGATASFTVTPNTGYRIASVTGCGGTLDGNSYTTGAITGACTVTATFGLNDYLVTATAGPNGSISPASLTVNHGATASFTVTPNTGYGIASVTGCGGTLDGNSYTTGAITAACTVNATFSLNTYEVTATAGANGSIRPASLTINHGATASFTVTPDIFYSIGSVTGCSGSLGGATYTTGEITGACTVDASFTAIVPTGVTATAGDGEVTLVWNPVVNVNGYRVYWGIRPGIHPDILSSYDDFVQVGNGTSRTIDRLINETLYYFIVIARVGNNESEPSAEVSATPASPVAFTALLNDTGIDWCTDGDTNFLDCPEGSLLGQDGELGRDAEASAGVLLKTGAGEAGFDFTKLDAGGNILAADAGAWSCVRDNHTGLIWEVKGSAGGLRDFNHTYTWYSTDENANGGSPGTQNGGTCTGSDCDTQAYVQAINVQSLCGASDWRLPTRSELMSIIQNGRPDGARIDTDFFPNTSSASYWSSTPLANDSNHAWSVDFSRGGVDSSLKRNGLGVRLVRGRP